MRPRNSLLSVAVLFASVAATACIRDSTSPKIPTIEGTTFASSLGVDLANSTKTPDGVYYRDITVGTGNAIAIGDSTGIYYHGYLPNGFEFDSLLTGTPFGFKLGASNIIPGLQIGMLGMQLGGVRQIIMPPDLAYGPYAVGQIPPNSILVFNVSLQTVK